LDRERVVLVADPDVEAGKAVVSILSSFGLQPVLVHDGVEALLTVQRMLPKAVILDAALPKMYGFQICEMMKRNESLRPIHVVLVGSVHHRDRYRRPPSELYGADVYLEKPELLASLGNLLKGFGYDVADTAAPPQPSFQAAPPTAPPPPAPLQAQAAPQIQAAPQTQAPPQAQAPQHFQVPSEAFAPAVAPVQPAPAAGPPSQAAPAADDGLAQLRADAERLARIIVSDILLYHPDQFAAGLGSGQLAQTLSGAIEEGRGFFAQRVDPRVRDDRDYLMDELLRVARERGGS
jgi:CheY-like chemotaxis protein